MFLGSNSHHDKHQVVGQGGDGYEHEGNRFDQVSADLQNKCKVPGMYKR